MTMKLYIVTPVLVLVACKLSIQMGSISRLINQVLLKNRTMKQKVQWMENGHCVMFGCQVQSVSTSFPPIIPLKHCEEHCCARTVPNLAEELNVPELPTLIHYSLYAQLHPDRQQFSADVPLWQMPVCKGHLDVFHSAMATFFASSDPSGIGGLHQKHI